MKYKKFEFVDIGSFNVSTKNRLYEIRFYVCALPVPLDCGNFQVSHITKCRFYCEAGLCEGYAYCSTKDTYNTLKGMKLSLTRALHCSEIKRKRRKAVWEAFFEWYNFDKYFNPMPFSA